MRLLIVLLFCFYGFAAKADACASYLGLLNGGVATKIAITEKIYLNEVRLSNNVIADAVNIEFWVEECVSENYIDYSLMGTVSSSVPGKSNGSTLYNIAVIQNNIQFDGVVFYGNNLFVPYDFFTALRTRYNTSYNSVPLSEFDLSQPFTLVFSCNNLTPAYYDACSAVNSNYFFEISPQSDRNNVTLSSVNGAWYDPDYNGSGFNMVQTANGLQVYFYGYKAGADGEALWLASFLGPKTIQKGETFTLEMTSGFIGNGGSLTSKPNTPNSGLTLWGTADITFDSCSSGEIILTNTDGDSVTHDIILLAGAEGLNCEQM